MEPKIIISLKFKTSACQIPDNGINKRTKILSYYKTCSTMFYVEIDLHILKSVCAGVFAKQKWINKHLKHLGWSSSRQSLVAGSCWPISWRALSWIWCGLWIYCQMNISVSGIFYKLTTLFWNLPRFWWRHQMYQIKYQT